MSASVIYSQGYKEPAPSFLSTCVVGERYTRRRKANKGDKGDKQASVVSGTALIRLPTHIRIRLWRKADAGISKHLSMLAEPD